MERALVLGDWAGYAARREQSQRNGRLRGISVSNYIEVTSGAPRERAEVTVMPNGRVELVLGTLRELLGLRDRVAGWVEQARGEVGRVEGLLGAIA